MKGKQSLGPPRMVHERPTDRVRRYLCAAFDRPGLSAGARLPPVRRLASHLNVGVATVHHILKQLAREGRLRAEVGNGTFLVASRPKTMKGRLKIALNIPLFKDDPLGQWGYLIGQAIFNAAADRPQSPMILPLSFRPANAEEWTKKLLEELSEVDGLILYETPGSEAVRQAYEKAGKPVVHVNPPADCSTANFVSSDYHGSCGLLGKVWAQTGRRRVVFLKAASFGASSSTRLSYAGLATGLELDSQNDIALRIWSARSVREEEGCQTVRKLLDRSKPPDAVYCTGDLLALGAVRALGEGGLRIPQDVSVVGGTGLDLANASCSNLTRAQQPFEKIGAALLNLLCERIEQNGRDLPGRILPVRYVGGATTRPQENQLFEIGKENREPLNP
ncbi:MAG: substrate-binding domain-containing protein [Verrucomicrobia bacterium]|nr:substrate-binding domain-containing protein [Verrucomicrobiota bacterium]